MVEYELDQFEPFPWSKMNKINNNHKTGTNADTKYEESIHINTVEKHSIAGQKAIHSISNTISNIRIFIMVRINCHCQNKQ